MDDERGVIASYAAAEGLPPIDWSLGAVAALWPTLDHLRRQGLVVVIKLDGERQSDEFTVVINDVALDEGAWARRDAGDVETGLVSAPRRLPAVRPIATGAGKPSEMLPLRNGVVSPR